MKRLQFHQTLWGTLLLSALALLAIVSSWTVVLAQEPTVTPSPVIVQPPGMFITVITEEPQINVRLGPSSSIYPVVGILSRGATAPALGRSPGGDWIQIDFPGAPNDKGWVYSPLVSVSPGALQVVEPPPTLVPPPTATIDPTLAAQFDLIPTVTRLPTFTPPPALTVPAYTDAPSNHGESDIPMAIIILCLGLAGLVGLGFSLLVRR
jgi:hypothetical protein